MDHMTFEMTLILAAVLSLVFFLVTSDPEAFGSDATPLDEMHHLYLGLALVMGGILGHETAYGLPARIVGVLLMADDAFQHAWRTFMRDPRYYSGLTRTYWWVARCVPAVRWLTTRADCAVWWLFSLFRRG